MAGVGSFSDSPASRRCKMSGRDKGDKVQVLLRCRPFSGEELRNHRGGNRFVSCIFVFRVLEGETRIRPLLRNHAPQVVKCNDFQREVAVSQNIAGKQIDRVFTFDKVFGPTACQRDLYDQAVIPIVNEVLEGFNCTIFAYGQTGTGKTHTMEGECKRSKRGPNGELPPEAGVIPRAVQHIVTRKRLQHRKHYHFWTLDEVVTLVDSVDKYGVCRWSEIKRDFFASNSHRTSGNLKDKWRSLLRASGVDCSRTNASIPIPAPILAQVRALAEREGGVEIVPE